MDGFVVEEQDPILTEIRYNTNFPPKLRHGCDSQYRALSWHGRDDPGDSIKIYILFVNRKFLQKHDCPTYAIIPKGHVSLPVVVISFQIVLGEGHDYLYMILLIQPK